MSCSFMDCAFNSHTAATAAKNNPAFLKNLNPVAAISSVPDDLPFLAANPLC